MRVKLGVTRKTATSTFVFAVTGCASSAPQGRGPSNDQDAAIEAGSYTYFAIAADLRKCASPVCGGWFLERLNRSTTVWHDGSVAAQCYTPVLDWSMPICR